MKKVFVYAYINKNLGDDLFLKVLKDRFPNREFTVFVSDKNEASYLEKYGFNVWKYSRFCRRFDKVCYKLFKQTPFLKRELSKYNETLIIGGSMFMEEGRWQDNYYYYDRLQQLSRKITVVGANFGPVKTDYFLSAYQELFSKFDGIVFRDKPSLEYFEGFDNISLAPDAVFNLELPTAEKENIVGISVVNLANRPALQQYEMAYVSFMKKIIGSFLSKGYRVHLLSFCEAEGDLDMCDSLKQEFNDDVTLIAYNGVIDQFLDLFASYSYVVGTRFHSMILGWLSGAKVLPIAYSSKTINVIDELNPDSFYIEISNLPEDSTLIDDSWFSEFQNLELVRKQAKNQFRNNM
ncbi:polysaccharide pyruvyl transferase family protein [Streptococcus suis]|uniref:polysaccharide pyruvyl transferase family protein n=1 Tax=Streptococcus suis TaxID=1307 RepID=UPI0037D6E9D0